MNSLTIPRARRPVNARVIAVSPPAAIARRCGALVAGLGTEQERGARLHRRRAGGERCARVGRVGDPAGRDERQSTTSMLASSSSSGRSGPSSSLHEPRWPPASAPCTTRTSAPAARAARASCGARDGHPHLAAGAVHALDELRRRAARRSSRRPAPARPRRRRASRRTRRRRSAARRARRRSARRRLRARSRSARSRSSSTGSSREHEEVDPERRVRQLPRAGEICSASALGAQVPGRDEAEAAGVRDGRGELRRRRPAGERCQDDRDGEVDHAGEPAEHEPEERVPHASPARTRGRRRRARRPRSPRAG